MKRGFTLVEMLVVIGIIAALIAASLGGYTAVIRGAEKARARELVRQVALALTEINNRNGGAWPPRMAMIGESGGILNDTVAYPFVSSGTKYLSLQASGGKLVGYDRFGILDPWGKEIVKRRGTKANLADVQDHLLWFAVDTDGDGMIRGVKVGGEPLNVRATAIVWCAGKDGKMEAYSNGLRSDDVYSWAHGQTKE